MGSQKQTVESPSNMPRTILLQRWLRRPQRPPLRPCPQCLLRPHRFQATVHRARPGLFVGGCGLKNLCEDDLASTVTSLLSLGKIDAATAQMLLGTAVPQTPVEQPSQKRPAEDDGISGGPPLKNQKSATPTPSSVVSDKAGEHAADTQMDDVAWKYLESTVWVAIRILVPEQNCQRSRSGNF